ncbi:Tripartite motif containing 42 [Mactra antiquata]
MAEGGRDLSYSQENAGDSFHELCCTRCTKEKKNQQSVKYCTVCNEYFCGRCLKTHNSFSAMRDHVMVDTYIDAQSSKTAVDKLLAVPTELCPHHPMKVIDMYCRSENVVGCNVCFNLNHKNCVDIHYIPKYVKENTQHVRQINQICKQLTKASKCLNEATTNCKKYISDLDKSKTVCKNEINKYRQEINNIFDDIENRTLTELEAEYKKCKQSGEDRNSNVKTINSDLMRYRSDLASEQVNVAQKFVLAVMSQGLIKQSVEIKSKSLDNLSSSLTFKRNVDIFAFLLNIFTLGMFISPENQDTMETASKSKQTKQPTAITATKTTSASTTTTSTTTTSKTTKSSATGSNIGTGNVGRVTQKLKKQDLYRAVNKAEYNIKQSDDSDTCDIWSSCVTSNNDIVIADFNNNKIKLVNSKTYNKISSLLFDATPWSVCNISSTEVVVCLGNNTLQFVSTCNNLVVTRSLSMKHACRCITVSRDRMYICDNRSLYIYNMNGTLIKTIKEIKSGDKIFSSIRDITISDDHNMINIVDLFNGVIALDMNGKICWKFSGEVLRRARGVCTDGFGNVIVCGYVSHNVVLLGHTGDYMGEIVTKQDGVWCPRTVCFDQSKSKLYVGCDDDDNITVFTL